MRNVIEILRQRGLIDQQTSPALEEITLKQPLKVYVGFDPTADALHLGHMLGIIVLRWFQRCGHSPIAIVGGATGMIGDPSGKSIERVLLDQNTLEANVKGIARILENLLPVDGEFEKPKILNNWDWFKNISFVDFLRDTGRYFRVNAMLQKESVKQRLSAEEGISFTEFSYQLLQAYDFHYLNRHYQVRLQMGGSDQWGNITAGCEFNRKLGGEELFGLTWPLLMRSDGRKFGKSEEGAVWLCAEKYSPYRFYQYLLRVADSDVISMLKMLTFVELETIASLESQMQQRHYVPNTAQKLFAAELTKIVHGEAGLKDALEATEAANPGKLATIDPEKLKAFGSHMPGRQCSRSEVIGHKLVDLLLVAGLVTSKGEGRRLLQGGGAYLNNAKIDDEGRVVEEKDLLENTWLILGAGKKNRVLIEVNQ